VNWAAGPLGQPAAPISIPARRDCAKAQPRSRLLAFSRDWITRGLRSDQTVALLTQKLPQCVSGCAACPTATPKRIGYRVFLPIAFDLPALAIADAIATAGRSNVFIRKCPDSD